jgi:hypothetical protein
VDTVDHALKRAKEAKAGEAESGVALANYFKAKGLRWHTVILTSCNEGLIPHKRAPIEDERRLFMNRPSEKPGIMPSKAADDQKGVLKTVDESRFKGTLKDIGGSQFDGWNRLILDQVMQALWFKKCDPEALKEKIAATYAGLLEIKATDVLEGMMSAQPAAAHNAAMECYRRAMIGFEGRRENLAQANKLSRTYATLLEALNRHRGKGHQKVTVEHVHVHAGGQAVVGMVETPGGGDCAKPEDQPYAKQVAHAPQPTLRRPDAEREPVSITGNAERPLPDARRSVARRPEG